MSFFYRPYICHKMWFSLFLEKYPSNLGQEQLVLVHQLLFVQDSHGAGLQLCRSCRVCLYMVIDSRFSCMLLLLFPGKIKIDKKSNNFKPVQISVSVLQRQEISPTDPRKSLKFSLANKIWVSFIILSSNSLICSVKLTKLICSVFSISWALSHSPLLSVWVSFELFFSHTQ